MNHKIIFILLLIVFSSSSQKISAGLGGVGQEFADKCRVDGSAASAAEEYARQKQKEHALRFFSATGTEFDIMTRALIGRLGGGTHVREAINRANQVDLERIIIESNKLTYRWGGEIKFYSSFSASHKISFKNSNKTSSSEKSILSLEEISRIKNVDEKKFAAIQLCLDKNICDIIEQQPVYSFVSSEKSKFYDENKFSEQHKKINNCSIVVGMYTGLNESQSLTISEIISQSIELEKMDTKKSEFHLSIFLAQLDESLIVKLKNHINKIGIDNCFKNFCRSNSFSVSGKRYLLGLDIRNNIDRENLYENYCLFKSINEFSSNDLVKSVSKNLMLILQQHLILSKNW
jgi:hypothetical protein